MRRNMGEYETTEFTPEKANEIAMSAHMAIQLLKSEGEDAHGDGPAEFWDAVDLLQEIRDNILMSLGDNITRTIELPYSFLDKCGFKDQIIHDRHPQPGGDE